MKICLCDVICVCVFRVSSRESSPRFSTWLGRTTAYRMTPLISWTSCLWYGPNAPDRTSRWWYTAGTVGNPSIHWFVCGSMVIVDSFPHRFSYLQCGDWSDGGSDHHGDGVVSHGVWSASVSSRYRQDHERPEGHDDTNTCM